MEPEHSRRHNDGLPKLEPIQDHRERMIPVKHERRGQNPQRKGFESHDMDEVDTAFKGDE